ncbi:unnamed protein product [Schistosoma margrebowiei]|uniref:Uncharacterized protein n=1 Tax=Schistosoma margrebowiei TaxID=48269 RepID=A0A183LEJ1_9TREM|nr:unnamed protein product [Schistosoma margrebowiei]
MKLKLKKHWTMGWTTSQKFNTAFLQDANKLNKFKIVLNNKFQAFYDPLNGEGTTMESNWKGNKEEGEVITNIEEQRNRWAEHFKELLNRPVPLNPPNIEAAHTDLSIDVVPPTIEEISMAIRQIKSDKVAGPDNIPAEALKAETKSQLCGSLWNNQLNEIHHSTSNSLTTKRHLTAWTEQHYGSFFDTTAYLRRYSISYRIPMMD